MSFIADRQTTEDLNLLSRYRNDSIFSFFNGVCTAGGAVLLENWFRYPLTDADAINHRSTIFRYYQESGIIFPFKHEQFTLLENYLGGHGGGTIVTSAGHVLRARAVQVIGAGKSYEALTSGLRAVIEVLAGLLDLLNGPGIGSLPEGHPYRQEIDPIKTIFRDTRLQRLIRERHAERLPLHRVVRYDHLLRHSLYEELERILQTIYRADVYASVAAVALSTGLSYARALPREANRIRLEGLRHPAVQGAVSNSVSLNGRSNTLFLTGANMAGKSTFMKAFGIAVYLAHMGFPVAADDMEFSVRDGLFSSINVPDNLEQGYSHFYAEVLRVKTVAVAVSEGKDLIVLFDELFKGTNVKDAYDATLAVTAEFSENRNCAFIISTHLIEVGEALQQAHDNLQFVYFPTEMKRNVPVYTYRLQNGITADRHGMLIIRQERILDLLNP